MILTYHKVHPEQKTSWWVTVDEFYQHMQALTTKRVVYLDDYDPKNSDHVVITFDGIYSNIHEFALPILKNFGYPFELFVIGNHIGLDNGFDQSVEPPCMFASIQQLRDLCDNGGRLQWHTRDHIRLNEANIEKALYELSIPSELQNMFPSPNLRWFAYPHGIPNPELRSLVGERFVGALACDDGDPDDPLFLPRKLIYPNTSLYRGSVAVIVANYNYGHLLREAIFSLERQSSRPDEILVIDDASTDSASSVVLAELERKGYRVVRNDVNLGIVSNFKKAVSLTSSDYVFILGADNKIRIDYIELCRSALDRSEDAAVAYTDGVIFGSLSGQLARRTGNSLLGHSNSQNWDVYTWNFPEPTPDALDKFAEENFIHGSSMYRRRFFDLVGGYTETNGPEDHNLFYRIWKAGGQLVHVGQRVLEYRQHSAAQANTALVVAMENMALREHVTHLSRQVSEMRAQIDHLSSITAPMASPSPPHGAVRDKGIKRHLKRFERSIRKRIKRLRWK
jgi:GT2 family glycosyltransferase